MCPPSPRIARRGEFAGSSRPPRDKIRDMRTVGLVFARIVAWGWFLLAGVAMTFLAGCSSSSSSTTNPPPIVSSSHALGVSDEMIGSQYPPMTIKAFAKDPGYGYTEKMPIPVGGGFGEGGHNTYRYLNALAGPRGQRIHYTRVGTCCAFKTPNSPFGGEAPLEVWEITYEGGKPMRLYFNWYDPGEIAIPAGLTARK